jgi:uncharacterized protein
VIDVSEAKRFYRDWTGHGTQSSLLRMTLVQEESDLEVFYSHDVTGIEKTLTECRRILTSQIQREPSFLSSLVPIPNAAGDLPLIRQMKAAARISGVGPMAAVAGAVAEYLGSRFNERNRDLILENGGDLYLSLADERRVMIYAGESPFSNRLALRIKASDTPVGVCTSSGTFGHSLSFGKADAVVAVARDTALADAAATAIANRVHTITDIEQAIRFAGSLKGLQGVVVIVEDRIGVWGDVELSASSSQAGS